MSAHDVTTCHRCRIPEDNADAFGATNPVKSDADAVRFIREWADAAASGSVDWTDAFYSIRAIANDRVRAHCERRRNGAERDA